MQKYLFINLYKIRLMCIFYFFVFSLAGFAKDYQLNEFMISSTIVNTPLKPTKGRIVNWIFS